MEQYDGQEGTITDIGTRRNNLPVYKVHGWGWDEDLLTLVFPVKWAIRRNVDNSKAINSWINAHHLKGERYDYYCKGAYIHSDNVTPESGYRRVSGTIHPGYTEITFEQFKKYVMKEAEESKKNWAVKITEDNINLLIKWRGNIILERDYLGGYMTSDPFGVTKMGYCKSYCPEGYEVLSFSDWFNQCRDKSPVGAKLAITEYPLWFVMYSSRSEFDELKSFYNMNWAYADVGGYATDPEHLINNWVCKHDIAYTPEGLIGKGYVQITMDEWREHFRNKTETKTKTSNMSYFVTREQLKTLYEGAKAGCSWRKTITDLGNAIAWDKNGTDIAEDMVDQMFRDANSEQREILKGVFPTYNQEVRADSLQVGEIIGVTYGEHKNTNLMMTYGGRVVNLNNPEVTWGPGCGIAGKKLKSGETVIIRAR